MQISKLGWIPDIPDRRDHLYSLRTPLTKLTSINLQDRYKMPPVYDQGNLGSCTANAIGSMVNYSILNKFEVDKTNPSIIPASRLFIYYNERVILGTVGYDSGAMIRDGIKSVAKQGVPSEAEWPYITPVFQVKPPPRVYTSALETTALEYQRLDNTNKLQLVDCLASGHPFVMGFAVYESFMSDEVAYSGEVPMPDFSQEQMLGGHAVWCYRYRMSTDRFYFFNSWGLNWGNLGRFSLPAEYVCNPNLADDFWTIKLVK
jgi:C1A family cysteine protease